MKIRKAHERGHADFGWLSSYHSFSFGEYYDPAHMGFGPLRVINDDTVAGGAGFPAHPHKDMEIISYVLEGALQHRDSTGGGSVILPGDVQRMSAGAGIRHSEFNASESDPVHFLQIWIMPDRHGIAPGYEQKNFSAAGKQGRLRLVVSPDGRDGSLKLQQDASVFASLLDTGSAVAHHLQPGRMSWIQIAGGAAQVNGARLDRGDGAAITDAGAISISGLSPDTDLLLFDMAA